MLAAHEVLAVAVVAAALVAAVAGGIAFYRRAAASRWLAQLLALVQTLLVAQVGLGLLLLADDRRSDEELHYAYGSLALAAVLAPWFYAPSEPRPRLLWFAAATLIAGALATRAYMTA